MNKQLILFSTIIITILTLIWSILNYYGFIRYIKLYLTSNGDRYIDTYKTLEKADTDNKIILNIYADNLKNIYPVLLSLIDQTVKVDEISLNIHNDIKINKIHPDIQKIAKVYYTPDKYDPTILPLLRQPDANTIVIYLNAETIYGHDFIQEIINSYKGNKCMIRCNDDILLMKPSDCLISDDNIVIDDKNIKSIKYDENYRCINL